MSQNKPIQCPKCTSTAIVKKGIRKNKLQILQQYQCKNCKYIFTTNKSKDTTYPITIILKAISNYNLGYTLKQTQEKIEKSEKIKIPLSTISSWLNQYKNICTYNKLRPAAIKQYDPQNIIFSKTFQHIQPYTFKFHKAKLYLLFHNKLYNNQFYNTSLFYEPLKAYLEKIPTEKFPHHIFTYSKSTNDSASSPNAEIANNNNFNNENKISNIGTGQNNNEQRASQIKFSHLKIETKSKNNLACKLASLALNLAATNKQRHPSIQNFFLINDSTTIAAEMPIYLTNWDAGYYRNQKGFIFPLNSYTTPITGHIDILQIRNGLIHILDYKSGANKQKPIEQLTIYALALSRKLNLPLYYFKCAWFDENSYFEFFPLHAVYKTRENP